MIENGECDREFLLWCKTHPTDVSAAGLVVLLTEINRLNSEVDRLNATLKKIINDADHMNNYGLQLTAIRALKT
jgi:hypothetical protein